MSEIETTEVAEEKIVSIGDNIVCGMAYYDYGIKPIAMFLNNNSILYIGFGKKI